jgi:sulfoxide reductase heme-binding subunit YedZ
LKCSGYTAAVCLSICLCLSPLSKNFSLFKILARHKREVGLASFYYALLHVFSYFAKKGIKNGALPWKSLLKLMVIPGAFAFLILFALTLTSNRFSYEKLGGKHWKSLHRAVYAAACLVFLHMALQGGEVLYWGLAIFIPLSVLRLYSPTKNIFRHTADQDESGD